MLRATFAVLALTFGALIWLPVESLAAGRGSGLGSRPPAGLHHAGQGGRGFGHRVDGVRPHGRGYVRHARHRGRFFGGPALYGFDPAARTIVTRDVAVERPAPVDPFAFANLPVRAGMPYPPRPEPTLYRLEGRRDRPVIRVIRIGEEQARGRTTGHLHAETGALLLTVPGR